MSDITLQEQIEAVSDAIPDDGGNYIDHAVLASLKRLQAIEWQEPYFEILPSSDIEEGDYQLAIRRKPSVGMKLYALPPDMQGMIDALTAERDELSSECEKLKAQLAQGELQEIVKNMGDFVKLLDDYAGAVTETAIFNLTQHSHPIRLVQPRYRKILTFVDSLIKTAPPTAPVSDREAFEAWALSVDGG